MIPPNGVVTAGEDATPLGLAWWRRSHEPGRLLVKIRGMSRPQFCASGTRAQVRKLQVANAMPSRASQRKSRKQKAEIWAAKKRKRPIVAHHATSKDGGWKVENGHLPPTAHLCPPVTDHWPLVTSPLPLASPVHRWSRMGLGSGGKVPLLRGIRSRAKNKCCNSPAFGLINTCRGHMSAAVCRRQFSKVHFSSRFSEGFRLSTTTII